MSHVQSTVSTVMVPWPSIFELTLSRWSSEQLYTVSVRLGLLSLGCSSCSDADPGTSASALQAASLDVLSHQPTRAIGLAGTFRDRESECARMRRLCKKAILAERNRFADFEIALH